MLLEISVENFGIIGHIRWQPGAGLNALTGETGAGKSLVADAIEALVGKRVGEEVIRAGQNRSRIEGVFTLDQASAVRAALREAGIEDDDVLILSREIEKGRTVNRVNGRTVPLRLIQETGRALIDIHGQSDHVSLNDPLQQLLFLDRYAGADDLRLEIESRVERLHRIEKELKEMLQDEREVARRADLLGFQVDEIRKAELHEGEEEELQQESRLLSNAEKLKSLSEAAHEALYGTEASSSSAADRAAEAARLLRQLVQTDESLNAVLQEIESAVSQIEDAAQELRTYHDRVEYDPARLEHVEQRLDLIRTLKRKYGSSIAEVIGYADGADQELGQLSTQTERRAEFQEECVSLKREIGVLGHDLSSARKRASHELAEAIDRELAQLNMPQASFRVLISNLETGEELVLPDGLSCGFTRTGIDKVEFVASTNPGEPPKSLAKIASTGEASRMMLAIKTVLSQADATPTLIFDEIDIGVGGRSGEVIGRKLSTLSEGHQVICVTHLPQVAVFADAHYGVRKELAGDRTTVTLAELSGPSRTEEISAMLGSLSEPTLESAQELLTGAERWKRARADAEKG